MVVVVHRILVFFKGLSGVSKGFDAWTRMKTCMKTIKLPIASNCNNSGLAKNQDPGWPRILMKHACFLAYVYMHIQQCQKTSKQPVRILVSTWVDVCLDIPHRTRIKRIYIYNITVSSNAYYKFEWIITHVATSPFHGVESESLTPNGWTFQVCVYQNWSICYHDNIYFGNRIQM